MDDDVFAVSSLAFFVGSFGIDVDVVVDEVMVDVDAPPDDTNG